MMLLIHTDQQNPKTSLLISVYHPYHNNQCSASFLTGEFLERDGFEFAAVVFGERF